MEYARRDTAQAMKTTPNGNNRCGFIAHKDRATPARNGYCGCNRINRAMPARTNNELCPMAIHAKAQV
jgi:hypothetical protein